MLKKGLLYILPAILLIGNTQAQVIGGSAEAVVQRPKPAVKVEKTVAKPLNTATIPAVEETEEEPAPVAMTPEQKAEIDIAAKKNLKMPLKRQNLRERKDFIQAMTSGEKIQKRRQALLEGKDEKEALEAEEEVKVPDVNPASNSQMEKYLYEKAGLTNDK